MRIAYMYHSDVLKEGFETWCQLCWRAATGQPSAATATTEVADNWCDVELTKESGQILCDRDHAARQFSSNVPFVDRQQRRQDCRWRSIAKLNADDAAA